MKRIIFELRLMVFTYLMRLAATIIPKQATNTLHWILTMPVDEWETK